MILRSQTTKQELLDHLITESSGQGTLEITVESLPHYLDTSLAFSIFFNQLKGYPRSLQWYTNDTAIFTILANSKIPVSAIRFSPPEGTADVLNTIEEVLMTAHPKPPSRVTYKQPKNLSFFEKIFRKVKQTIISPKKITPTPIPLPARALPSPSQSIPQSRNTEETLNYPKPTLSATPLADQNSDFQRLQVLKENSTMPQSSPSQTESHKMIEYNGPSLFSQDTGLDSWLANIEKAKESLQKTKQKNFFEGLDPASSLRDAFEHDATSVKQKNASVSKWVIRSFAVIALLIIAGLAWFKGGILSNPDVYTIRIKQERKEQTMTITIPTSTAKTSVFETRQESTINTSGKPDSTKKAQGTIALINESSQSISLNNAGFYLQKGSTTYAITKNADLPNVLTIPGNTTGNNFTFTATANIENATPIATGEKLTVRNLQGQIISDKVTARAQTEIAPPKSGNYVTQTDLDALTKQNNDKNQSDVTNKLNTLPADQYSLASLVHTEIIKSIPNPALNSTGDTVQLTNDFKNTMQVFDKAALVNAITKQSPQAVQVEGIQLISSSLKDQAYTLELKTITYNTLNISSEDAKTVLGSSSNLETSKDALKSKYPLIESVDKKNGFPLFHGDPVIKIEVIQN